MIVGSVPAAAFAASSWPASAGTDIGTVALAGVLPAFDASGAVYHAGLGKLVLVGDDGDIVTMKTDGSSLSSWKVSGDPEDITIADTSSNIIYFSDENAGTVSAFDLSAGALTGAVWNVSSLITTATRQGIEAMTFVPNGYHPYAASTSGGLFYVGSQYTGEIAVLDINTSASGTVSLVATIATGHTDLAGLNWNSDTRLLYATYDGHDLMAEFQADGTPGTEYSMPTGIDQEGITVLPDCLLGTADVYVADDGGPNVWKHTGNPIATETVYADLDGDGLGDPTNSGLVCVGGSRAGYVANANDTNDYIPNAGIEIARDGKDNDGDGVIDEYNTIASNGAHPYYSTLSAKDTSAYGTTIASLRMNRSQGTILVEFSDASIYEYAVWSGTSLTLRPALNVFSVKGSAYAMVSYNTSLWRIYNLYTGANVPGSKFSLSKTTAETWAASVLGL